MKSVLALVTVFGFLALTQIAAAKSRGPKGSPLKQRAHVAKYDRKDNRPNQHAERGPKHQDNNYKQNGWY